MTPNQDQQGKLRAPAISLGVLAVVLMAAPCVAAPAKTAPVKTAPVKAAPAKPAIKTPAAAKPPAKTAPGLRATPIKTAAPDAKTLKADVKTPVKTTAKSTTKAVVVAAKTTPAKPVTKAAQVAAVKPRVAATLASATPAKPVAKPAPAKPAVTSPVKVTMDLSKVPPPAPVPVVEEAPPPMNAAPVPYQVIAARAPAPSQPAIAVDTVLAPYDVELYQTAFSLIDSGDYAGAETALGQVHDKTLMGYAEYHKLFSLGYTSTYDELISWLNTYGDQPMAMSVWNLAKRKKPAGSADPAFPSLGGRPLPPQATASISDDDGVGVQLAAYTSLAPQPLATAPNAGPGIDDGDSDLTPKSARSAYNNGQLEQAVVLGRKIGDHWVTGLAEWRLGRYDQAEAEFKFVSTDPSRNAWSQSSGAYWAGRCALKQNHPDDATTYFKIAASFPFTFYGLVAEARLGVTPAVMLAQKGQLPTFSGGQRDALSASLSDDFSWTKSDAQAVRLNALVQIGRDSDAQKELQAAVQTSTDNTERDRWLALAAKTRIDVSQLRPADRLFDASIYPMPAYAPKGGFTVDKALVYAFARKESKFNPKARSYSGAYGLLQLMPGTAALIEGDSSFSAKPAQLLVPAVNLKVGQDYIQKLSDSPIMSGDLLRTIAAYNAGPRPVKDALDSLGQDADSLLVMESIPVAQTRQYVEEVAANYWIYRQLMGQTSKTLAMAATDAKIIDADAD